MQEDVSSCLFSASDIVLFDESRMFPNKEGREKLLNLMDVVSSAK